MAKEGRKGGKHGEGALIAKVALYGIVFSYCSLGR